MKKNRTLRTEPFTNSGQEGAAPTSEGFFDFASQPKIAKTRFSEEEVATLRSE
jgi:hypothetical protein